MYSRRPCSVLTGLCKEKNKNLNKLKKDVVETLCETGISEEEITNNIGKFHRTGRTDRNNTQSTIIKFKSHSFKEKIYFKRKAITQRDQTIINKTLDQINERCQYFGDGQPWDQLSLCICRCTRVFENSFERCKE